MADIFVFGTNGTGFHGAGSAGYAMLGIKGNQWRTTLIPGTNMTMATAPNGTKGLLAVKGVSRGLMIGTKGASYGIQTVTKPGARRSIPLSDIKNQLFELKACAQKHNNHTFHLSAIGTGYAGYTEEEINRIIDEVDFPPNVVKCVNFSL